MTRQRRADDPEYGGIYWRFPDLARLAEAKDQLAELKTMRASGVLKTRIGEREVYFKSDAELLAAIAALEAELNPGRPRNVMVRPISNKGFAPGNVVTVTAPAGGVKSGDVLVVGALIGIATSTRSRVPRQNFRSPACGNCRRLPARSMPALSFGGTPRRAMSSTRHRPALFRLAWP
jgi:hypothetical protein